MTDKWPCYFQPDPKHLTREDEKYKAWVRKQPCAALILFPDSSVVAAGCKGNIEAAHRTGGGMGKKGHDDEALPLCAFHHRMEHRIGVDSFWMRHREELVEIHRTRYEEEP